MCALKRSTLIPSSSVLFLLAVFSLFSLQIADAEGPASSKGVGSGSANQGMLSEGATSSVIDVKLHSEGLLVGQLFNSSGTPLAGADVTLSMVNGLSATATTNDKGGFAFSGAQGAVHLSSKNVSQIVRVWEHHAAPPKSSPAVLLVQQDDLARGQHYSPVANNIVKRTKRLMGNPLMVAGIVGTAVAVPVAIHNDDDDPAS